MDKRSLNTNTSIYQSYAHDDDGVYVATIYCCMYDFHTLFVYLVRV